MVTIGEDVTEKLVVIPIQFKVEQHIRPKYACRRCDTVTAARVAPSIIEGGMATPSVLTWVLISKYTNHLPLYRIAQIAEREGVILARSTLGDWVGRAGLELSPLYDRLKEMLLSGNVLHVDETPIKQLDPGNKKTHKSYLWGYRNNDLDEGPPIVLFDYQAGRAGAHARNFLGNWRGFLCVDDFVGYKALFTSEDPHEVTCIEVGCLAHARRKFFDLFAVNQSPMAAEALDRIGKIYDTERAAIGLSPEDRQVFRVEKTLPLLKDLKRFLKDSLTKAPPNGAAAKAINYSLKRWEALERFAHTGNLPIDNNPLERDIRPIAIGKRNWLFVGSERAGKRAAVIQSLLGTARLNGINPNEWLENVLENLPVWPNKQLDELLPIQGWKPVSANV
jgi:transposase